MTGTIKPTAPLGATVFRGALFMVALRYMVRGLGLISVLITARMLTPADFGIIGTAAIVTGFFAVLQQIGISEAIIRLPKAEAAHVETAWTLNVIACALISAGIFAVSGLAAETLREPALTGALRHLAFTPLLNALSSPGTSLLLRDMQFGREFRLRVLQKVVLVLCSLAGAFWLRSWWGLVYGTLAGTTLSTLLTYAVCPYKPVLRLDRRADFLNFSFWTLVQAIAVYAALAADELAVRRTASTAVFGLYHTSRDLSRTLVGEAMAAASAALLPGLARLQEEPVRFARVAAKALGASAILVVAFGVGVSLTAREVIGLLLGAKWVDAAPFLALTAIGSIGLTFSGLHRGILAAQGKTQWSALLWVLRAAVMLPVCMIAARYGGPIAVARSYAATSIGLALLDYVLIFRMLGRPWAPWEIFARPAGAGAAMAMVLLCLPIPEGTPLALSAAAKVLVGGAVYGTVLSGLWWLAGRPIGAETALIERLPVALARRLLPA